jgi:hypothetical protein
MANRYSNLNPAQFAPFSMQEIFTPPQMMRTQHDAAETKALEMEALDINRLSQDNPEVTNRIDTLRSKIGEVSSQLAKTGFDRNIQNNLQNIRKEYVREMSPSGYLGHAQQNYMTAQEGWKTQRESLIKAGAPPDYVEKTKQLYMTGAYQGVGGKDGQYNEFTPGRVPGYHDIPAQLRQFFSTVNTSEIQMEPERYGFIKGPNGQYILWDKKTGTQTNNAPQLTAALNAEMLELQDPSTDRGYSAKIQNYTDNELLNLANYTKDAYFKQTLKPADTQYQPLSFPPQASDNNRSITYTQPSVPPITIPKPSPGGVRGTFGRGADPFNIVWGETAASWGKIEKPIGSTVIDGPVYISSVPGAKMPTNWQQPKSMPRDGISLKDAKEVGYTTIYELDSVEEIPENEKDVAAVYSTAPGGRAVPRVIISPERKKGTKSVESLNEDRKLKTEIDKLTRQVNPSGGAWLTVEGDEKSTSLPNLSKDTKILVDSNGRRFVIYKDNNAEIKVYLRPRVVKEIQGVDGNYKGPETGITDKDRVRAFIPATREDAIAQEGMGAPIPPPINLGFTPQKNGAYTMNIYEDQPIWNENSVLTMFDEGADILRLAEYNALLLQRDLNSGLPEVAQMAQTLGYYGVNLNTVIDDFKTLSTLPIDMNNPKSPSILDGLRMGILKQKGTDHFLNQRWGANIPNIQPVAKEAIENVINFMSALEVIKTPKKKE